MRIMLQLSSQNKAEEHDKQVKKLDAELKDLSGESRKTPVGSGRRRSSNFNPQLFNANDPLFALSRLSGSNNNNGDPTFRSSLNSITTSSAATSRHSSINSQSMDFDRNASVSSTRSSSSTSHLEQNLYALQFVQTKNSIVNSVKHRLRNIQNSKRSDPWNNGGNGGENFKTCPWRYLGTTRNLLGKHWEKYKYGVDDNENHLQDIERKDEEVKSLETFQEGQEHPNRYVKCCVCNKCIRSTDLMEVAIDDLWAHVSCFNKLCWANFFLYRLLNY